MPGVLLGAPLCAIAPKLGPTLMVIVTVTVASAWQADADALSDGPGPQYIVSVVYPSSVELA